MRKMSVHLDAGRLSNLAKGAHLLGIALRGSPILLADGLDGIRTTSNFGTCLQIRGPTIGFLLKSAQINSFLFWVRVVGSQQVEPLFKRRARRALPLARQDSRRL